MRTACSAELNGDGFFSWVEWGRLFLVGAGRWSTQVGGRRRWVVGAGGWSAQVGGRRSWVVIDLFSDVSGQRSWVVNAAGWSAQLGGRRSWVVIDLFSEMRAHLQQVLARIGASEGVNEGFLPDSASECQSNRRVVLR